MRRCWFYVKIHFWNYHHIFTFWDPLCKKKRFLRKCLCVCPMTVDTIILDRIMGLDWNLGHPLKTKKERTSQLINHFLPIILISFIKNVFVKIINSFFPPKFTKYGFNVEKQNSLFQRDLQILCHLFFHRSCIFCLLMKIIIKNKKLCFLYTIYEKYFTNKIFYLKKRNKFTSGHFLVGRIVFVLIVKNVIKTEKFYFEPNLC